MIRSSSEQLISTLTESQRLVLTSFRFSWDVLSVKEIKERVFNRLSTLTIRRALAKLVNLGVIQRREAKKKGRGYSNLYQLSQG